MFLFDSKLDRKEQIMNKIQSQKIDADAYCDILPK